ncbi:MAG: transglycosylase SLT domain-containing protein [Saprospiraceae bacterium]|nr:transglycosylase SLT domain-containing protein [Saprospiraceae bacterium]
MNKKISIRNFVFFIALSLSGNPRTVATNVACSNGDPEIEKRVMSLPSKLELRYNDQVKEQIAFFIEKNRNLSTTLLGRAPMYFPQIEAALSAHQLPDELKYLPVIEAALVPYVSSHVGASGLWQFMKPTAQIYGLKITNVVDERKDPEKSTQAAMFYLKGYLAFTKTGPGARCL